MNPIFFAAMAGMQKAMMEVWFPGYKAPRREHRPVEEGRAFAEEDKS